MSFWLAALVAQTIPNPLYGRSIQVDAGFEYFHGRSSASVASEMRENGYRIVRYVVTNDRDIDDKLIAAFHAEGIAVWYETFGNGFYGEPTGLPANWKDWKAGMLNVDGDPGFTFLSLSHPGYRAWKRDAIVKVMKAHAFDAAEVVEPFQLGWDGPEKGLYGDLSPVAQDAFRKTTGYDAPPEFKDKTKPSWYKTDTARYCAWVEFRVREVNGFLKALVTGYRKAIQGKPICIWALANTAPDPKADPVAIGREWQGIDAAAMVEACHPDLLCFQTNWPDWSNPALPGDYPKLYKPFIEPVRKAFPRQPFIVQADIGSLKDNRRSRAWIRQFEDACAQIGACGSTAYAYQLGLWMYSEKPEIRRVERHGDEIRLVFQKRLDPLKAIDQAHYAVEGARVLSARWDGNEVWLRTSGLGAPAKRTVRVSDLPDDAITREVKNQPANLCNQSVATKL